MLGELDRLRWKRALVTGGTKGLGQAVVARLTEMRAKVLTTARSVLNRDGMFVAATSPRREVAPLRSMLSAGTLVALTSSCTLSVAPRRQPGGSLCSMTTSGKRNSTST
jgi:NAD(P)-dependent dehydrogenase (short-subunit alcohol dehydrogenase family)